MVLLSASKVMVGDNKTKHKKNSIEIRGPLASTKEHQNVVCIKRNIFAIGIYQTND